MGIAHLEDLPVSEFLDRVESLSKLEASEKLDGANLNFGIDADTNKLFTSREGKRASAERIFNVDEYPNLGSSNPFRPAHLALQAVESTIREIVQPGQLIEAEVLFGRQPNAITYGNGNKSYIAFLSGQKGTSNEVANKLTQALQGKTVEVEAPVLTSSDGESLSTENQKITFEFVGPQKIDLQPIQQNAELQKMIKDLNDFLIEPAKGLPASANKYTNGELAEVSMSSVKMDIREEVKLKKEELLAQIRRQYQIPIKKFLHGELTTGRSALTSDDVASDEDIGIEGIVLRDPTTGDMFKLVDKTSFTALNTFNHAVRRQIGGTVKSTNPEAPLESRGGIIGHTMTQVAKQFGEPELARSAMVRKIFANFDSDGNPINTVKAFAATVPDTDFQGMKRKLLAILAQGVKDLTALKDQFKDEKDSYALKLSNGKSIGITPEIERRTNLSFAEGFRDLKDTEKAVKEAKSLAGLIAHIYRRYIPKHGSAVTEAVLAEKRQDTDTARYTNKDPWTLLNIYFANVFMAALIYKVHDKIGLRMLRDKTNFKMMRWNKEMSQLNFWGYPIWRANTPAVQKLITVKGAKALQKVVSRVPASWFRFLHMDLSFGKDVPINWNDHYKTMKVLQQYPGMNIERINILLKGTFNYENLTFDQKVKVLNLLHVYVQQFIPYSPLLVRLKAIQRELIFSGGQNLENSDMIIEDIVPQRKVAETADCGVGVSAIAAAPMALGDTVRRTSFANIVKRKRNPDIKFVKFKKPDNSAV